VEQRADKTARLPRVAAEDAGLPSTEGRHTDAVAAASEDAGKADGYSTERTPLSWSPAGLSGSGVPGDAGAGLDYRSPAMEGTYAGPTVDDGYGPPGTQRDYPAPPSSDRGYPAPPAETIYGSAAAPRDYAAPLYPAQVSPSPPPSEPDQAQRMKEYEAERATEWQAPPPYPAQVPSSPPPSEPDQAQRMKGYEAERATEWQAPPRRQSRPQVVPKVHRLARTPRTPRAGKSGETARQAHLTVTRLEPWSVMKFSFIISLVCFVILFVAVALLYGTLAGLGVFDAIQRALSNVTSSQGSTGVNASHWFSASTVLGYTALLGALDVVLITAFATVGSVIYNLVSNLVGGVEVTLRETE
jgi:hypothetical protein